MELQILVRDLKETNSIERIMWEQTTLDDQGKEIKSTNTEKKSPLFWGGVSKTLLVSIYIKQVSSEATGFV